MHLPKCLFPNIDQQKTETAEGAKVALSVRSCPGKVDGCGKEKRNQGRESNGDMGRFIGLMRFTECVMEESVARHREDNPGGRIDAREGAGKKAQKGAEIDQGSQKCQPSLRRQKGERCLAFAQISSGVFKTEDDHVSHKEKKNAGDRRALKD